MGQWSALPRGLLEAIEERLILYPDKVRLSCVCASWQSALPKMPNHRFRQLPWLLLPHGCNGETSCGLFNPIEKRVYIIDLPEARGKLFRGSSHGWVVTVEESPAIYVVNPLTRVQVRLPPRSRFPDVVKYRADKIGNEYALKTLGDRRPRMASAYTVRTNYTEKIVLSSQPTSKDWVAVAIYGEFGTLAYCKYGDKKWSTLHDKRLSGSDVIFHRGQFYVINGAGHVMIFDIGSSIKMTKILPPRLTTWRWLYLVESGGELIMVERDVFGAETSDGPEKVLLYKTQGFNIFRLDTSSSSWCQVKNLGDDLLFLGSNSSLVISSREFPEYTGNRIYFTDDIFDFQREGVKGGHDVGVFNVDDGSIEQLPGFTCDSRLVWPPPIWVMPNPYY